MNGDATAPMPAVPAGPGDLLPVCERILAELEGNRKLTRMAIAAHPDDKSLVVSALRLADLQAELREGIARIRSAALFRDVDDLISEAPDGRRPRRRRGPRRALRDGASLTVLP